MTPRSPRPAPRGSACEPMNFVAASPDRVARADRARPSKRIRLFMGQMSSLVLRSRSKFFCTCARSFSANRSHFAGSCARTTRSCKCPNSSRSCMPLATRFLGQAVVVLILGLVECAPSDAAAQVRWFVVDTKFPPSSRYLGRPQVFGECFRSHIGVK